MPGDQIRDQLTINYESSFELDFRKEYEQKAKNLNLDKPLFYFSILPKNFPPNLNEIYIKEERRWFRALLFKGYSFNSITSLYAELSKRDMISQVIGEHDVKEIRKVIEKNASIDEALVLKRLVDEIEREKANVLLPRFHWKGFSNQYHLWISNLMMGRAGNSYLDNKPVSKKVTYALSWTLFLVLFSLFLSYMIGILIGVFLANTSNKALKSFTERLLFGIYAIPLFWLATLLLVFFTTSEYGSITNIFPSVGLVPVDNGDPWYARIWNFGKQLILPCFCIVIHNLAFIGSLTKRNVEANKKLGFVMTSRAYGFSSRQILLKDVLPYSMIPLITSLSSAIPSAIGGSLVIEIIFNIPGMGRLLYNAILNYDWPVVFTVTIAIAVITISSYFLAEVLYRKVDPRIK